jgi:hypothetical protein
MVEAFRDRFANIPRLEQGQFTGALFDLVGDSIEDRAARFRAHPRPFSMLARLSGGTTGFGYIRGVRARNVGEQSAGRWLNIIELRSVVCAAVGSSDEEVSLHGAPIQKAIL